MARPKDVSICVEGRGVRKEAETLARRRRAVPVVDAMFALQEEQIGMVTSLTGSV